MPITGDEIVESDKKRTELRLAIDRAKTEEEKAAAIAVYEQAEKAHQAMFQTYTQQCQQDYLKKFIGKL